MSFLVSNLAKLNKNPLPGAAVGAGIGQELGSQNQVNPLYNSLSNMAQQDKPAPYQFKQPEQFSYNAATDPQLANALQQANASAKTATNNAMVGLGARGIGNSSIAVDRGNQIQQTATSDVYTNMLPQFIQQAYQRYQDTNNNQFRTDTANYNVGRDQVADQHYDKTFDYNAGRDVVGDNQWQKTYDANRTDQADNLAINKANLTGNYENPDLVEMLRRQAENSAAYGSASPNEQKRLHDENLGFSKALGQTYDPRTGKYSDPITSARTLAGQTQDSNKQQNHIDLAQKLSEMYGVHVDPKNDPALAYKQVARLVPLNKQNQEFEQAYKTETQKHNFADDAIKNGISQQNANTSSANGAQSRANSKASNQRAIDALDLSKTQREFASSFIGELAGAETEEDVKLLFKGNAKELSDSLGVSAYTKLKNDSLAQFQKVTPTDKQDSTIRSKAIKDAQADDRWDNVQGRNALISEYEAYYK